MYSLEKLGQYLAQEQINIANHEAPLVLPPVNDVRQSHTLGRLEHVREGDGERYLAVEYGLPLFVIEAADAPTSTTLSIGCRRRHRRRRRAAVVVVHRSTHPTIVDCVLFLHYFYGLAGLEMECTCMSFGLS